MAVKQQSPNPKGRPKGSANKIGQKLQSMLNASLSRAGGIDYLVRQSEENPAAYMTMISKLLPKQVESTVTHDGDLKLSIPVDWVNGKDS